jgi:hypothetical protein
MRRRAAIIGGTVMAVLAVGTAYGVVPAADGTITSCYDSGGVLRIVDAANTCPSGTTRLTFNQKGPQGDGFHYKGAWNKSTDQANGYAVGDVVSFSTLTDCPPGTGSYVKTRKVPANSYGSTGGWCSAEFGWEVLARDGRKGDPGPGKIHWVKLAGSDGHVLAKSDGWSGNWGTGRYYAGWDGVDLTKCAISVTPLRDYTATPVMAHVYTTYSSYTMFEVEQIKPGSWPIAYENINADVYVTASCT